MTDACISILFSGNLDQRDGRIAEGYLDCEWQQSQTTAAKYGLYF